MKPFIKKILLFTAIPFATGLLFLVMLTLYLKASYQDYPIGSNISILFAGDSHIQSSVDDRLIPHSLNIAKNSESLYFTYYKLKMLLDTHPSIKQVFLGVSYHSLSNYFNQYIDGVYSASISPRYFFLLPFKEQIRVFNWNRNHPAGFLKSIFKKGMAQAAMRRYSFMGGFINSFEGTTAVDSSMEKRIKFQYYTLGKLNSFSAYNIRYLSEIEGLCQARGVELTVLSSPLHDHYYKKVPKAYKDKLNQIITTNKLNYIDLTNLPLDENCYIPDGDHVSFLGAKKTSKTLREMIDERTAER